MRIKSLCRIVGFTFGIALLIAWSLVEWAVSPTVYADQQSYSLRVSPNTIASGEEITVAWKAPAGSARTDWVGFYLSGQPDTNYLWRQATGGAAAGTFSLKAPLQQGQYEFRYFSEDTLNRAAISNPLVVVAYQAYGLNFSPYLDGQDPNLRTPISEQQLRSRMEIIAPYTKWIRTFGTVDGLEKAGRVAKSLGLKAAIGAWLGRNPAANEQQIANLITIARAGECDLAIVGSEVLLRGDLTEAQLVTYLNRVRQAIPAGIPVATADVYGQLLARPNVIANVDVVMPNFYPFWENVPLDLALPHLHGWYAQLKAAAQGKPIWVSESGWPSGPEFPGAAKPSLANAHFFFLNFVSWARANNVPYFYFSAFDERWKEKDEGAVGSRWGVWDKEGNLKPGMQDVFDGRTVEDNWTNPCKPGDPMIAFTYVPPYGSFNNLLGQVCGIKPEDYGVAVYIRVRGLWWVKPTSNQRVTIIQVNGTWACDITTGGIDHVATELKAYLLPKGFDPPNVLGSATLPPILDQSAKAMVTATRSSGPCQYAISPTNRAVSAQGDSDSIAVTNNNGVDCTPRIDDWMAVSNVDWITITSGSKGSSNGKVEYTVAVNTGPNPRTGTITIAGNTFTVTQTGTAIACGQSLTGYIKGERQDRYTFEARAGDIVILALASRTSGLCPAAQINDPTGKAVPGGTINSCGGYASGPITLPLTGIYTIVVSAPIRREGPYNLGLTFIKEPRCAITISCGETTLGYIKPGKVDIYKFDGTANWEVQLTFNDAPGGLCPGMQLYDPTGTAVPRAGINPCFGTITGKITLPLTGTYTILVTSGTISALDGQYYLGLSCGRLDQSPRPRGGRTYAQQIRR